MEIIVENSFSGNNLTLKKAGRAAGIIFLFNLIVPTLSYVFIQSKLYVEGNSLATVENILAHTSLFRLGMLFEIILAVGLIGLGYSLFVLLKNVNKYLSKFAFILKVVEASLMTVVTLFSFFALQLLVRSNEFSLISENNVKMVTGFILNQHGTLNAVPMVFLGTEMIIFTTLLYKSAVIPRMISVFGIFSFILILIYATYSIIYSASDGMLLTLPSFFFELICGSWLLIKGISIEGRTQMKPKRI